MKRRIFVIGAAGTALGVTMFKFGSTGANAGETRTFEFQLTDEQWRERLSPMAYKVLREHGTERSGTSPLDHEKRVGTFACAGCDLPLFDSSTKYDSGTGWPSFYDHLPNAIGTSIDKSWFAIRTEVHCRRCGGHLGHVFEDGPKPTGLRYCMNGVAMKFIPRAA
jgi:peptide-methionine (R)-S-oxide reductase